ncbi:MAG: 50S ribosomal protein L13 [Patescibacteria group bacterium]
MTPNQAVRTIDAANRPLGRLATELAGIIRGKGKIGFTYHQDHGDRVIVINPEKILLTGRKMEQKKYYRHSTYPGGLTEIPVAKMLQTHPERVIRLAVRGMLPDNRLRAKWLKKLVIKLNG